MDRDRDRGAFLMAWRVKEAMALVPKCLNSQTQALAQALLEGLDLRCKIFNMLEAKDF